MLLTWLPILPFRTCGSLRTPHTQAQRCQTGANTWRREPGVIFIARLAHRCSLTHSGAHWTNAAERWPEREALVVHDQAVRLNFSDLRIKVDQLAAGLIALDLRPGDRVGLWSPNRIEWVLTQYATAKAGLILVNINPGYRATELEYALNKVECRALITSDQFRTTDYIGILRELAPELEYCPPGALRSARLPHLTTAIHFADADEPGYYRFSEIQA